MTVGGVRAVALAAPAKVNLGLRIRGRRADGYHLLESLFVPLVLGDRLTVRLGPARGLPPVSLRVSGAQASGVPADATNLAWRAAVGFLETAGRRDLAVAIELEKGVPAQAGLGGGSSDAAAVLRGLSALLPNAVPAGSLAALALGLGADVPFFLAPRPALVRGVGERIEPVEGLPTLDLLLVHPGVGLSTAEVYGAYDALEGALTPPEAGPTVRPPEGLLEPEALAGLLENDLEPAARRLCPPLARLRQRIAEAGAVGVGMSGSGPTLFGVFRDEGSAHEAAERLSIETAAKRLEERAGRAGRDRGGPPAWIQVTRTASAPPPVGAVPDESIDGASPNW